MSRLIIESVRGELSDAVNLANKCGARFVFSMHPLYKTYSDRWVQIIWKFDDYPSYVWWCGKRERVPVSVTEFFE